MLNNEIESTWSLVTRGYWRASLITGAASALAIFVIGTVNSQPLVKISLMAVITGVITVLFTRAMNVFESAQKDGDADRKGTALALFLAVFVIGTVLIVTIFGIPQNT